MAIAREPFYDPGPVDPVNYARQLLLSREFPTDILEPAARDIFKVKAYSTLDKAELAEKIAPSVIADAEAARLLAAKFAAHPRRWLAIQIGETTTPYATEGAHEPHRLFQPFEESGWYGPIMHPQAGRFWYVYATRIAVTRHTKTDSGKEFIKDQGVNWYVVAEVGPDYGALVWEGFSYAHPHVKAEVQGQYPFWDQIPTIFRSLADLVGGKWSHPALKKFVLDDLWEKYRDKEGYEWTDLKLRANHLGVGLSATSAPRKSDDNEESESLVKGLQALTQRLAMTALKVIEKPGDTALYTKINNALLNEVIKEWRPLSYEFSLDRVGVKADETNLFRAHVYFGEGGRDQDLLRHFRTYKEYGHSEKALRFLINELPRPS